MYKRKKAKDRLKTGPKGPHKNPALVKITCNTKLPRYVMEVLREQPNQAECIAQSLILTLKIKTPC